MKKLFGALFIVLFCFSCRESIDFEYLKSKDWLFDSGDKCVGDFIRFDSTHYYTLSSDTIIMDGVKKGIVTSLDTVYSLITIESIDGHKTGKWVSTDKAYDY